MEAIDEWLDHMRLRRKKPKSIEAFRQIAYRAMRESGWREVADLTHDNITAWIQRAATESGWKGSTINHRMTALHSLTERLYKRGLLPHDPLADAIRAEEDDSSEGARAGTLAEARAIVLRAWIREQNDRRCKGNRTLYWACLFAMGCRLDEPARWKWKHVQLELNPPRLCWTPDINKGKKRREQPIPQWLADRLREHRAQGGVTERKDAQGSATETNADDPVFPVTPNKATFAQDREAAGIPFEDYRGRKFTPHAARKFYSTFLTGAGVSEKMVDYLMRHQGGVEGRYYDPSADDCAAAVAKNLLTTTIAAPTTYETGEEIRLQMVLQVGRMVDILSQAQTTHSNHPSQFHARPRLQGLRPLPRKPRGLSMNPTLAARRRASVGKFNPQPVPI
jgi:integrase